MLSASARSDAERAESCSSSFCDANPPACISLVRCASCSAAAWRSSIALALAAISRDAAEALRQSSVASTSPFLTLAPGRTSTEPT